MPVAYAGPLRSRSRVFLTVPDERVSGLAYGCAAILNQASPGRTPRRAGPRRRSAALAYLVDGPRTVAGWHCCCGGSTCGRYCRIADGVIIVPSPSHNRAERLARRML
jgi:hypothetical protein